ncbi:hypothetical protein CDAR_388621 [Caerostris darwini]|uniref:Uncharacterized protein n=1 Tax=Caerostris darwini TaxID=1538125 RepID=A0AAV4S2K4_9ARAC|nr:hypothetical protein CDAR_388621 [Caerostris darwini]
MCDGKFETPNPLSEFEDKIPLAGGTSRLAGTAPCGTTLNNSEGITTRIVGKAHAHLQQRPGLPIRDSLAYQWRPSPQRTVLLLKSCFKTIGKSH